MTHIVWRLFTRTIFVTWAVALIVIAFWQLYPYEVPSIVEPIKILNENKQVKVGEVIIQELQITKPNNNPPQNASRTILCDNNLITLPANLANNLPVGKYTVINEKYVLPETPVGAKCVFIWRQEYPVNPIRRVPVEWRSESFTVVD